MASSNICMTYIFVGERRLYYVILKKTLSKIPPPIFFILQSIPVFLHTLPHAGARPIAKPQTDQHNTAAAVYAKKAVYTTTYLHLVLFFYQSSR